MEKNMGFLTKFLFKIHCFLNKYLDITPKPSEDELIICDICSKLIKIESTILSLSPISNKKFMHNDEFSIYCIIYMGTITLINDGIYYSISPENNSTIREIVDLFDQEVEKRREELEFSMRKNFNTHLQNISKKLSQ
jgi:hypothetical protein